MDVKVQRSRGMEKGGGKEERAKGKGGWGTKGRTEWAASEEATSRYAAVSIGSRRDSKRKPDKPGV